MVAKPKPAPPYFRCDGYDPEFHPAAMRAVAEGQASDHQQKMIFKWIVEEACATYQQPFIPGDPHATAFMAGRIFAGQQILKMLRLNPGAFRKAHSKETDK